jgi:hypothetical protein
MSENEEIARIRIREAIQEGLASQKYSQAKPKFSARILTLAVILFLLGVWLLTNL